jgi:hypothetical protein
VLVGFSFRPADDEFALELILSSGVALSKVESRLLVLRRSSGLRHISVLLPVPRMTTGLRRSRKKASTSLPTLFFRLDGVLSSPAEILSVLTDRPNVLLLLLVLPLRPRVANLP